MPALILYTNGSSPDRHWHGETLHLILYYLVLAAPSDSGVAAVLRANIVPLRALRAPD
jgi:hypothetical protein